MAPLGLSLGLFAFWSVLGWAVLAVVRERPGGLRDLLLAPAVGVASTLLPVFLANHLLSLPVGSVASPLMAGLALASLAVFAWRRPPRPTRQYPAFVAVFVIALLLSGRPMLEFGFDWLSFANDDMTNYVLGAQFFASHTFGTPPDLVALLQGKDYSQFYWYFYVPHAVRPGSELLLALLMSLTGLSGHQLFMPLILSLHLVLVSATAALVCRTRELWLAALVTAALLAVSALSTFGVLAQLIAQVAGLGLVAAAASVLLTPSVTPSQSSAPTRLVRSGAVGEGVLLGILGAALLLVYPEVLPFLVLGFMVSVAIRAIRHDLQPRVLGVQLAAAIGTSLVLINTYLVDVAVFLSLQVSGGLRPSGDSGYIFPYFLIPSGLADFWGFQVITGNGPEPWLSTSIGISVILIAIACCAAVVATWRGHAVAAIACGMLVFGARLFSQQADFGLFKLAMFVQPFLLGALSIALIGLARRAPWSLLTLVVVAAAGADGQFRYVELSRGGYTEIPGGSQMRIAREFQTTLAGIPAGHIVLDTINISLAKVQAFYTRGLDASFPSRDFFSATIGRDLEKVPLAPGTLISAIDGRNAVDSRIVPEAFALHDPGDAASADRFQVITIGAPTTTAAACDTFISTGASQSVFNRLAADPGASPDFSASPCSAVTNHLIFIHSQLGQHYYQVDRHAFGDGPEAIGIFPLENDVFFPGRTMAGVGRYLLFEVVNPTEFVRLSLDLTATLKADGDDRLPPAAVIGETRQLLPLQGRGSARAFSAPIKPQLIDGRSYVALDMGIDGERFADHRSALMSLYNTNIPVDRRQLVGFARDVSVVSEQKFANLSPPTLLAHFPTDLLDTNLQYAGVYEDGWVSESAYFDLEQPTADSLLSIQATVPLVADAGFSSLLHVLVDGSELLQRQVSPADIDVRVPAGPLVGTHRVELRFSATQTLPGGDGRPVAALLHSVGFVPPQPAG